MPPFQSILKAFILGSERSPLPLQELTPLARSPSSDAAQTLLEGLCAANLLRKAAFPISKRPNSPSSPFRQEVETRLICSANATRDLSLLLSGRYPDALPEFLALLAQAKLRLPPEWLPELLEKAERDTVLADKVSAVLGPAELWLAQQHPRWNTLLPTQVASDDWFTATFAERKRLLSATRARNPSLALAWLDKTWSEEKADHKEQFVGILHIRLSIADESLLEKALLDKNRAVRLAAARALMRLPDSRLLLEAKMFFKERLAAALMGGNPAAHLPDLSEEAVTPWLALLPKEALGDWRAELQRLFIRLLPPSALPALVGRSQEQLLRALNDPKDAVALLDAIALHNDDAWTEALLRHFTRDFRHALWRSKDMGEFLSRYAAEVMVFFGKNNVTLDFENQMVLRGLENHRRLWSKPLLDGLLEQYGRSAYGHGAIPGWHFAAALQTAAYYCHPSDATNSAFVRDFLQNPPQARPREFDAFLDIVRFRLGMRGHLGVQ